ncbi:hypothetical protein Mnod_8702 (plasmid) [Methylobacterium nodulans ORS 2060]|uniref:Uncharacterized protein n=1 Tax=Methylobacterium nodulans (strain LMG 21967 / CNCM I-2342 / ORS 2060) TaxID=460265 RepID=B8IWH2_METNO|nr:hypothetical protein Mnod_8702 [Methylobacterium nodulans ORS 2060]
MVRRPPRRDRRARDDDHPGRPGRGRSRDRRPFRPDRRGEGSTGSTAAEGHLQALGVVAAGADRNGDPAGGRHLAALVRWAKAGRWCGPSQPSAAAAEVFAALTEYGHGPPAVARSLGAILRPGKPRPWCVTVSPAPARTSRASAPTLDQPHLPRHHARSCPAGSRLDGRRRRTQPVTPQRSRAAPVRPRAHGGQARPLYQARGLHRDRWCRHPRAVRRCGPGAPGRPATCCGSRWR